MVCDNLTEGCACGKGYACASGACQPVLMCHHRTTLVKRLHEGREVILSLSLVKVGDMIETMDVYTGERLFDKVLIKLEHKSGTPSLALIIKTDNSSHILTPNHFSHI